MQLFIQTRGKIQDYAFVGDAPTERWWAQRHYRNATSYEKPTLILESLASGEWRCYISAIPSATRDRVGTMIRYTLVLSGSKADDKKNLLTLLAYMLDIFSADPASADNSLTALLDAVLAPKIDQWLSEKTPDVQASIQLVSNGIAALKPLTSKSDSLIKEIEKRCVSSRATHAVALLNFVGSTKDLAYTELQAEIKSGKDSLLLLFKPKRMGSSWTAEIVGAEPQQEGEIQAESAMCPLSKNLDSTEKKKTAWMLATVVVIAVLVIYSVTTSKEETSSAVQAVPELSPDSANGASHDSAIDSPDGALEVQPDIEHPASQQRSAT